MSNRYKGAVISATPPSVQSGPGAAFAPGIWTTSQQMQYQAAGTWPLSFDPDFNQTVLLLHGDGTNGAQNNTFLDSSTNNFTITRNGNTTQGSFSPFSLPNGEWSVYFNGSSGLSVPDSADFTLGSSDWTIECWVFQTTSVSQGEILRQWAASPGKAWIFYINSSNQLGWYYSTDGSNETQINYTTLTVTNNQWNHIAFVRNGSTVTAYINGQVAGSTTSFSATINDSSATITTGAASQRLNGYCSNLRLVVGSAVYTSTFTPPTSPLTAVTNTKLLTMQSNRFVDTNTQTTPKTISVETGAPSVQPFSPFQPSSAYSTSVNGGSGYFDGTGDYLDVGSDSNLTIGINNFTISMWVYFTTTPGGTSQSLFEGRSSTVANQETPFILYSAPFSGFIYVVNGTTVIDSGFLPKPYEWYSLVVSRLSGTTRMFVNGTQVGSDYVDSTNYVAFDADRPRIASRGNSNGAGVEFGGYIAGLQVLIGTGYSSVSVPTAPPDPTGSDLCLNFTNAGIFDNTGKNNLETVADAQIDTTTKKWGTGSLEFDGTGDYLFVRPTPDNQLGSGDFTVEGWFYANSPVPQYGYKMYSQTGSGTNFFVITAGEAGGANTNVVSVIIDNTTISSTATFTTGTWNHFAVVRSSGSVKVYLNGSGGSATTKTTDIFNLSYNIGIGSNPTNSNEQFNGYLDDLRITKGIARYTADFTPPNGPFFNT